VSTPLFAGVLASNDAHKNWTRDRVNELMEAKAGTVAVLGLTYKPGTSTLRQSTSVELCKWLAARGMMVKAHDPAVGELPRELSSAIELCKSAQEALRGADLAILATEWPDYKKLGAEDFVRSMRHARVLDPNWFLAGAIGNDDRIKYVATGRNG